MRQLTTTPTTKRTTKAACVDLEERCSKEYCFTEHYMLRCKKTCKDCDGQKRANFRRVLLDFNICRDAYPRRQCIIWRRYGGCDSPNSSVFHGCRKTCQLCRQLEFGKFSWIRNPPQRTSTTRVPASWKDKTVFVHVYPFYRLWKWLLLSEQRDLRFTELHASTGQSCQAEKFSVKTWSQE